jgi:hypothetical protein
MFSPLAPSCSLVPSLPLAPLIAQTAMTTTTTPNHPHFLSFLSFIFPWSPQSGKVPGVYNAALKEDAHFTVYYGSEAKDKEKIFCNSNGTLATASVPAA